MKRYIKAAVQECPTLLDWLNTHKPPSGFIRLYLIDTDQRISLNGSELLLVYDVLRYLTNTSFSKFSNYLVVDAKVLGMLAGAPEYVVYIAPPN